MIYLHKLRLESLCDILIYNLLSVFRECFDR